MPPQAATFKRKRKQFPPKDSSQESRSTQQSITVIDLLYCRFIATICFGLLQNFSTLKAQCLSFLCDTNIYDMFDSLSPFIN